MFKFLKANTNRTKNKEQTMNKRKTTEERCRNQLWLRFVGNLASFSLLPSSFLFFLLNSRPLDLRTSFLQPPSRLFIAKKGIWDEGSSPRRAGYFTIKLFWWHRRARGLKKCKNDPFALSFEYFLHSFLKCPKTLRIAPQLVLSS